MTELISDIDHKTLNRLHRELSKEIMRTRIRKAKKLRREATAQQKAVPFSISGGNSTSLEIG